MYASFLGTRKPSCPVCCLAGDLGAFYKTIWILIFYRFIEYDEL